MAVLQYHCKFVVFHLFFNIFYNNYTSVDSQRRMQYNDLKYVNVGNKIEILITEFVISSQYFELDYFSYP